MGSVHFTEDGWEDYLYWQSHDKQTLRKINSLIKECMRTPFDGTGKPEPLKGGNSGKWSRRINEKDRLVYKLEDGILMVYQCMGHYTDK